MARTYRDKNRVKRREYWNKANADYIDYINGVQRPTSLQKVKRRKDDTDKWTTPSWWTRITMNVPRRREARRFEHKVLLCYDLEICDPPVHWKKPHNYYW